MTEPTPADQQSHASGRALCINGRWVWQDRYPAGIDWKAKLEVARLDRILDRGVEKYAQFPAVDFMGRVWTYRDLGRMVGTLAAALQTRGVKKGVKVGLLLPNTIYSIIFYFAVLKCGATVVNYNPLYVEKEIEHQIADSGTDIMVTVDLKLTMDKMLPMLDAGKIKRLIVCPFAAGLPFPKNLLFPLVKRKDVRHAPKSDRIDTWQALMAETAKLQPVDIDPENDIAVLQYTGGTTGTPKGAALSHANIYTNVQQAALWMGQGATPGHDSMVAVLPFFHVFAMTVVMNLSLWAGMKILLQPKFDIEEVLKLVEKHRPSYFPAVPAIYNAIASHPRVGDYDFSCLRVCLSGGAPLPVDVKRHFEEKTGSHTIFEGYGLSEASPIVTCNPLADSRAGSIGMPLPGTTVEIIDRDDGRTVMATGEKGEVCVRGPQVMMGYYNKPEESAKVLRDGRLHTGDVGYVDDEGYIYIVDRIKDLIIVRGYNVYPRVVEEAIQSNPDVQEVIVAGVPDEERGETVWAWVKPVEGRTVTEAGLHKYLDGMLNPIEIPRKIIIREKPLPKTPVGKLSRKDLLIEEGITRKK